MSYKRWVRTTLGASFPRTVPVTISVGGTDRTGKVPIDSLTITQYVGGGMDTATFRVTDAGALPIANFDDVVITGTGADASVRYFAGFVTKIVKEVVTPIRVDLVLSCSDYSILLDKAIVAEVYTGMTDAEIVADLVGEYASDLDATLYIETMLGAEDLPYVVFNWRRLRDCLDVLAHGAGADWLVDYGPGPSSPGGDKLAHVHYYGYLTAYAPWGISTSPDYSSTYPAEDVKVTQEGRDHINRVMVLGGDYLSADTDFILPADGNQTELLLPYVMQGPEGCDVPRVYQNDGSDPSPSWAELDVGVDHVSTLTTQDVLWNRREKLLLFASAPPALLKSVKVTCRYEIPVRLRGRNTASYDTYGRWLDGAVHAADVRSYFTATHIAHKELRERDIADLITCTVREPNLGVGEYMYVYHELLGLDGYYQVQQITARFESGSYVAFDVVLG